MQKNSARKASISSGSNQISIVRRLNKAVPGEITAILCVYKRAGYFEQQVAALRAQTVPPKQIWGMVQ